MKLAAERKRTTSPDTRSPDTRRLFDLLDDSVSLERAWNEINNPLSRPTPQTTIEAILYCVRERGLAALKEPANIERLSRCDAATMLQIKSRIAKLDYNKCPNQ
jgi:hypothetical protein